jgi:hypothetical protein
MSVVVDETKSLAATGPVNSVSRDQTDPDAWKRARELALKYPFRRATPAASLQAIDDVMQSIGDTCPDCK